VRAAILVAPSLAVAICFLVLTGLPVRPTLSHPAWICSQLFALAVVLFDGVLTTRGFSRGSSKGAATGLIGFVLGFGVTCLVVLWCVRTRAAVDSAWAVQADLQAVELLKGCPDVVGLRKAAALEGSGHKFTRHPWDPIVIEAFRGGGGKETNVPRDSGLA
jgi:hypothetical protein